MPVDQHKHLCLGELYLKHKLQRSFLERFKERTDLDPAVVESQTRKVRDLELAISRRLS